MALSKRDNSGTENSPSGDKSKDESPSYLPGTVEFSSPLENSVSLEAPRVRYVQQRSVLQEMSNPVPPPEIMQPVLPVNSINSMVSPPSDLLPPTEKTIAKTTSLLEEKVIPLLEERVVVDRHRRKVGEVIIRKEVETRMIEVPVRRERLIVEQINPEHKRLLEVDLGEMSGVNTAEERDSSIHPGMSGEFNSTEEAIQFLDAIALSISASSTNSSIQRIKVSVVLQDENLDEI
jgi:Domain of unknown function (DUF2382)